MNARDNTPLRTQIAAYLDVHKEATAAELAKAADMTDTPSRVINELNIMRTDGLVECEQRGKSKTLTYWLAVPDAVAGAVPDTSAAPVAPMSDLPDGIKYGTRAARVWRALQNGAHLSASELATKITVSKNAADSLLSKMYRSRQVSREKADDGMYRYYRPATHTKKPDAPAAPAPTPAHDVVNTTAPAAPATPDGNVQPDDELGMRLEGVAHALRGSGLPALREVTGGEDLQPHVAALTGAYQMALHQIETASEWLAEVVEGGDIESSEMDVKELAMRASGELRNARALAEKLQRLLDSKTQECEALRAHSQPGDTPPAAGYLVRAPKRPLRVFSKEQPARAVAMAAARNGSGRGDVFALVPVGTARRGAEWRSA